MTRTFPATVAVILTMLACSPATTAAPPASSGPHDATCIACHGTAAKQPKPASSKALTASCIACHEANGITCGSLGPRPKQPSQEAKAAVADHPVGRSFKQVIAARPGRFHAESDAAGALGGTAEIVFADGEMGCLSCHDMHRRDMHALLRRTNASSALCLACHAM